MIVIHKTLFACHALNEFPDGRMSIDRHGTAFARLISAVATLRQKVRRLVGIIVGVLDVESKGEQSLVLLKFA